MLNILVAAATLMQTSAGPAKIVRTDSEIFLSNGLVSRRIVIAPTVATVSLQRLDKGEEYIRSVEPEGRLVIDGRAVDLGGSDKVPNRAFLTQEWIAALKTNPSSLRLVEIAEANVEMDVPHVASKNTPWPPRGRAIVLKFAGGGIEAEVRHEVYDGVPVLGKQITVRNAGQSVVKVEKFTSERLAVVEGESNVESHPHWRLPSISVMTTMSFTGRFDNSVNWELDPAFGTQVSYELKTPCILDVRPPVGPGVELKPGESLDSIKSYLVVHGTDDREERGLDVRKFFRVFAPWSNDNPLMLHVRSNDDKEIRTAIDQAAECGFEMVIMSFGSGLNMEDTSPKNIQRFKALTDYAKSKGIRFGGYSLLASRRIDDENDVINPKTGKTGGAIFGNSPCLGSKWGLGYFERLKTFISETGFQMLEHDGNYPGDVCASTNHPGHAGLEDSQWRQHQIITDFYRWCRERGVFLNVPDMYFLNGSNKTGMGYRETNWSLPREQQHLHARQNIFDGTWEKNPSMGWMFVPLVEYHGGGPAATIEPLKEHLADYELHFANTLANGVQACWRGTRLYDSPETKALVVRMVNWYKKYRAILESDIIHIRRPDGRRLDFVLHINSETSPKAMLIVFNPTESPLSEKVAVPLERSGLNGVLRIMREGKTSGQSKVENGKANLNIVVPARGWTYFTFEPKR